jgi:peptidoglycan/xylan/chitin deacetylase (PgdA/CDA1 family)
MIKTLTRITNKTLNTLRHPMRTLLRLGETPVNIQPVPMPGNEALFLEYGRLARLQGFDRLYIVLSFDCDTPEDIPAAEQVHAWLNERGLKATYAVPGAQLQQGADTYRRLLDRGADFINHGARPHAERRDGRYWSMTFYNEMTTDEVIEDIKKGHRLCQNILGCTPVGFRAPHFGYFQSPAQREVMYSVLRNLGYEYSTSTLPEYGLIHGPVVDEAEIKEIPLSGSYQDPYTILDSWNYILSPYEPVLKDDYANLFIQMVSQMKSMGVTGVLNYYVDPAHVIRSGSFYKAMEYLLENKIESMHFNQLLEIARK